ncbi:MAG: DMT family transporter [Acidobacteriota bacterium]
MACVAGPFGEVRGKGVAVALASAFLSAFAYVSVKHLARTDPPETIVVWFSAWATLIAGALALPALVVPDRRQLAWLVVTGVAAGCAQLLMTRAYAAGDAARISVYGYATPVVAYALGQIVLRERPGLLGIAGTALVVAAGILVSRGGPDREAAAA